MPNYPGNRFASWLCEVCGGKDSRNGMAAWAHAHSKRHIDGLVAQGQVDRANWLERDRKKRLGR